MQQKKKSIKGALNYCKIDESTKYARSNFRTLTSRCPEMNLLRTPVIFTINNKNHGNATRFRKPDENISVRFSWIVIVLFGNLYLLWRCDRHQVALNETVRYRRVYEQGHERIESEHESVTAPAQTFRHLGPRGTPKTFDFFLIFSFENTAIVFVTRLRSTVFGKCTRTLCKKRKWTTSFARTRNPAVPVRRALNRNPKTRRPPCASSVRSDRSDTRPRPL